MLGEPVGKQDPYVAAHGGICAYTFHPDGEVEVEPLELEPRDAAAPARSAAALLHRRGALGVDGAGRPGSSAPRRAIGRCSRTSHRTKEIGRAEPRLLEEGDLEGYAGLMHEHWQHKRRRSPGMSGEHIDRLYTLARRSGCIGGKLVGAGGGGFLLVYARQPEDTRQAMAAAGASELAFEFEFTGAYASGDA